ncbi:MAG: hypothetical protein KAU29_04880, partial [Gammaproteobacteria bacterium]|nr:hypothetical protein [Gammaproteobacteria bacterium]
SRFKIKAWCSPQERRPRVLKRDLYSTLAIANPVSNGLRTPPLTANNVRRKTFMMLVLGSDTQLQLNFTLKP